MHTYAKIEGTALDIESSTNDLSLAAGSGFSSSESNHAANTAIDSTTGAAPGLNKRRRDILLPQVKASLYYPFIERRSQQTVLFGDGSVAAAAAAKNKDESTESCKRRRRTKATN